jgi:hypothetical protein
VIKQHIQRYPSTLFDHDKNRKEFVIEASTLTAGRSRHMFSPLYDDACDEGFAIVSDKTGKEARFAVSNVERREGDILSWTLVPTSETARQNPSLADYKVVIFND